jgi:hypothetical protein
VFCIDLLFVFSLSGCGFVVYASKAAADKAIASVGDQVKLPGALRELIVRYAGPRPEETGSSKTILDHLSS